MSRTQRGIAGNRSLVDRQVVTGHGELGDDDDVGAGITELVDPTRDLAEAGIQILTIGPVPAELAESGADRKTAMQDIGAMLLLRFAEAIARSWDSGFRAAQDPAPILHLLTHLRFEGPIRIRTCEGYAHYGLYPESYLEAARRSGLGRGTCVIGIRSIGLGLAALVARALGAAPAISVRPVGDPFRRTIQADRRLIAEGVAESAVSFAVVDEGPGLSGSSFAAVAEWLIGNGVARERISFFPSHAGAPGDAASPRIRALWDGIARHPARQEDVLLREEGLAAWLSDLVGSPTEPPREITAPAHARDGDLPMSRDMRFERRKYLVRTASGQWLARFAGLGDVGLRKLRDASLLADARLAPRVAGFRHGFLVQEWIADPDPGLPVRARFIDRLARYLAFRAQHLPAPCGGASLADLRDMAVANAGDGLGSAVGASIADLLRDAATLEPHVRRVRTDNRLHAFEWIRRGDDLLKADAVDHCEAHDLIGCQDLAWDVAGASVEHDLAPAERDDLRRGIAAAGAPAPDAALVAWMIPCYLAFQFGLWSTAAAPEGTERARQSRVRRYEDGLARLVGCSPRPGQGISATEGT